jgi:acyl carrier protein
VTQTGEHQVEQTRAGEPFEEVLARVKAIIADVLEVDAADIGDDDDLAEEFDVDSLDAIKIALALAERFDFPIETLSTFRDLSVSDVGRLVLSCRDGARQ